MTKQATKTEDDVFTPSEYLMLEVLTARYRLGETHWTFPTSQRPTATRLEKRNLVSQKSGITDNTIMVWLADKGLDLCLADPYYPPSGTVAMTVEDLKALEDANSLLVAACSQEVTIKELAAKMDETGSSVTIVGAEEGISHPGLRLLAAAAYSLLNLDGNVPPNYHTAEFNGRLASGDEYFIEVASCKSKGQTPHTLRLKAEKERDALLEGREASDREREILRSELASARERIELLEGFANIMLCGDNMSETTEKSIRARLGIPKV